MLKFKIITPIYGTILILFRIYQDFIYIKKIPRRVHLFPQSERTTDIYRTNMHNENVMSVFSILRKLDSYPCHETKF